MHGWQRLSAVGAIVLLAAACSDDTDTGPLPSIGLSLSSQALSVEQAASGNVTATLSRGGGYEGSVALTVAGAPTGVTVTANPAALSGATSTSTITFAASAAAAPGTYPIVVTAAGSGVDDATGTVSLTITARPAGSYTIAVAPAAVTADQGASATTTVTLTRTNFTDEVTFSADNLPAGVTAAFAPTSTTATTSTLTLNVGMAAVPGSYVVSVRGTAGTSVQMVDLALNVTAPTAGGNVSFTFCEQTGTPVWVAYQDDTGPWTRVTADASGAYVFDLASGRGGIAFVTEAGGQADVTVHYGLAEELNQQGDGMCEGTGIVKTLNGSVAGLSATDQAQISMGGASAAVLGATGTDFMLDGVLDGPRDLFASRLLTTVNGTDVSFDADKFIIRRDLDLADGATIPVLDFDAAEAFDPETHSVTVNNAGTDLTAVSTAYFTDNGAAGAFFTGLPAAGTSLMYAGVPAAQQEATDLHLLSVIAIPDAQSPTASRSIQQMFNQATDRTLTLGPALDAVDVQTIAGAPYTRLSAEYMTQPEYDRYWIATFDQTNRNVTVSATEEYVGGGTVDLSIPDFTGADGWNPATWALLQGVATNWFFIGLGWTADGGIISSPFIEGGEFLTASRQGVITP